MWTGSGSITPYTATNGSAAQSQANREGRRLTIFDFQNIYADTQAKSTSVTINSGTPTTLTVSSGVFSPSDVGKYIVVPLAGPSASWLSGTVSSVPVATNGSAYTAVPTVSFSGSPTSTALAQPLMQISSVATNNAGTGCTAGTYTPTVAGGKFNTVAGALSVTIGGGGTVSAVSVSATGDYFSLPTATANTAGAAIPGCSVQPTFNLTFNLGSVYVQWGGNGYAIGTGVVTPTLSGGSPGVAATLGNVVTTGFPGVLATTIASYNSPTSVTLADAASNFPTSQATRITWGHDDCPGINAALSALPSGSALRFPYAGYGCAGTITLGSTALKIEGDGTQNSVIYSFASGTALLDKNGVYTIGGVVKDIAFDGNGLARFPCYIQSLYQAEFNNVYCMNAATPTASGASNYSANVSIGDGSGIVEQVTFLSVYGRNDGNLYSGSGDLPTYNFWTRASDNILIAPVGVNATQANFRTETNAGDTWLTNAHGWGSIPQSLSLIYAAQNCFEIAAYSWNTEPGCDIARNDGVLVAASGVHGFGGHLLGSQVQASAALSSAHGIEFAASLNNIVWRGFDAGTFFAGGSRQLLNSPYPTGSDIWTTSYGTQRFNPGQQNTESTTLLYGNCLGSFSTCNGTNAFVAANNATSAGTSSTLFGNNTNDYSVEGSMGFGYGTFSSVKGSAQTFDLAIGATTTDGTTAVPLVANVGGSAGNFNQVPVPTLSGLTTVTTACRLTLNATNNSTGDTAMWTAENVIFKNVSGTVSQVGSTTWTKQQGDAATSTWTTPAMTADSTNKVIAQTITGVASTTIRWVERAHCVVN